MEPTPYALQVEEYCGRKANNGIGHGAHASTPTTDGPEERDASQEQPARRKGAVVSVSCDGCRPQYGHESKISVVPVEYDGRGSNKRAPISIPSPNGIFKTIASSLSRRSPLVAGRRKSRVVEDDYWKVALGELTCKLIETTRERDGALLEVSNLKYSMVELEKKLSRLEVYCHGLKSSIEEGCRSSTDLPFQSATSPGRMINSLVISTDDKILEWFSVALSKALKRLRTLSRLFVLELHSTDPKVYEKISGLFRPYEIEVSPSTNPTRLILYLGAFLNNIFFEDFESIGFHKNATSPILNPTELCEANLASYQALKGMTWQGVLDRGTRNFSEGFSKYCDRKMTEIVGRLGWSHTWPEQLLKAFFGASKSVWLVHLLANSAHPGLPIFRVDKGARFDPVYMEDLGRNDMRGQATTGTAMVWFMVAPGFYIPGSIIKCKVVCRDRCLVSSAHG